MIAGLAEQGTTMPDTHRSMLDDNQPDHGRLPFGLGDAPPGPLAVHCSVGLGRVLRIFSMIVCR